MLCGRLPVLGPVKDVKFLFTFAAGSVIVAEDSIRMRNYT